MSIQKLLAGSPRIINIVRQLVAHTMTEVVHTYWTTEQR